MVCDQYFFQVMRLLLLLPYLVTIMVVLTSSEQTSVSHHNDLTLRRLIAHIHKTQLFCTEARTMYDSQGSNMNDSRLSSNATHIQSLVNTIFTSDRLVDNYRHELHQAVRFVSFIYRLGNLDSSFAQGSSQLLTAFLHSQNPVDIVSANYSGSATTRQPANTSRASPRSALFGLGTCSSGRSGSYVTVLVESPAPNVKLLDQLCSLTGPEHRIGLPGRALGFSDALVGRFSLLWLANQCEPVVPGQPPVVRLLVSSAETVERLSIFFEFDIRNFTLDQCELNMQRCGATTECMYKRYHEWPLSMDNYVCKCINNYYRSNAENGYPAPYIASRLQANWPLSALMLKQFECQRCPPGCEPCANTCLPVHENRLLRAVPLAFQSFCITVCLLMGVAVFRLRRTKVVKASNWLLLEILLIGAILLYLIVIVMYFPASDVTCLVLPWLRELGFAVMYGVLIVKIYRVLSCFLSRKAHRVHVRDKDILKFLGLFITVTITYMIAWTAVNLDYVTSSPWSDNPDLQSNDPGYISMLEQGHVTMDSPAYPSNGTLSPLNASMLDNEEIGQSKMAFNMCRVRSWDVVAELAEFVILAISIHYCRLVRTAPSEYNENLYISVALMLELVVSSVFNILRHVIGNSVHPDYIYLLYFARSHVTITVNLLLIFSPKAYYLFRPLAAGVAGSGRARVNTAVPYSADPNLASSGKLNLALNGDLDFGDVNLADMDAEVIRRELKRLYTQIELYRTKAMRKDNPHISRRRGGRKQRRFSLQPFHKRHQGASSSPGNIPLLVHSEGGCGCWTTAPAPSEHQHHCRAKCSKTASADSNYRCFHHHHHHHQNQQKHQPPQANTSDDAQTGATVPGEAVVCRVDSGTVALPGVTASFCSYPNDEEVSRVSEESTNSLLEELYAPPSVAAAARSGKQHKGAQSAGHK